MAPVSVVWHDDCAQIIIDNPPVNATSTAVRAGLLETLAHIHGARLAVLSCTGKTFVAGGDLSEFDAPPQAPHLPDVVQAIESSAVPVVAALKGAVFGGGFELACACAARFAAPDTRFALPEVNLGLVPGAGGTQRAPRLVGWDLATSMAAMGKVLTVEQLLEVGALDGVSDDPLAAALAWPGLRAAPTSIRSLTAPTAEWIENKRRAVEKAAKGAAAPLKNFELILRATEPFERVQTDERALHLQLRQSEESKALRHLFFAERAAAKPAVLSLLKADTPPQKITRAAVVGGGLMGAGIGATLLAAGVSLTLIEQDAAAGQVAETRLRGLLVGMDERGKLRDGVDAALARTKITSDYADAANAQLAIEAVFEDLAVKQAVFAELAAVVAPTAILATNTSYLDPGVIFDGIAGPERCVGLHFFSPAHIMRLVEVVQLPGTAPETLASLFTLAKRLKKVPVRSGVCDGFIGNRMLAAYRRAAEYMLIDGASPQQIDQAMTAYGMAMGPFAAQDMAGLQIAHANRRRQDASRPAQERYVTVGDALVAQGRLGQRSGAGWYSYAEGSRTPSLDPIVTELIEQERAQVGRVARTFTTQSIQTGLIAAMANEGAKIVEEHIAESDGAVDVVKVHGYGFPRWRGGPMRAAQALGEAAIKQALGRLIQDSPNSWVAAARYR